MIYPKLCTNGDCRKKREAIYVCLRIFKLIKIEIENFFDVPNLGNTSNRAKSFFLMQKFLLIPKNYKKLYHRVHT